MAGDNNEMFMTRSFNVTPKTTTAFNCTQLFNNYITKTALDVLYY